MPKFTKPPSGLVETFDQGLAGLADVERRQMFGYPAAFTRSQMLASLFQSHMIVRLSEADRQELRLHQPLLADRLVHVAAPHFGVPRG